MDFNLHEQNHQQRRRLPVKANVNFIFGHPSTARIDIGNSGTSSTNLGFKVYVGTSPNNQNPTTPSFTTGPSLPAGSINSLTILLHWASGKTYYFTVSTSSGQVLSFQKKAP